MDTELAYKVSSGFGAGMFQGETCGAVIGAYMALGLKYGSTLPSPEGDEQRVESIIKDVEFREKFLQKYNSTMCRELMGAVGCWYNRCAGRYYTYIEMINI